MSNVIEFPVWRTALYQNKLRTARNAGEVGYNMGRLADENPYHQDTEFYIEWYRGFANAMLMDCGYVPESLR